MVSLGKRIQQVGIDVVANAEGKQADAGWSGSIEIRNYPIAVCFAYRGQAIGEEYEVSRTGVIRHRNCFQQGAVDIGAAAGADFFRPGDRFGSLIGAAQIAGITLDAAAESHNAKAVTSVQVVEDVNEGSLSLLEFFT